MIKKDLLGLEAQNERPVNLIVAVGRRKKFQDSTTLSIVIILQVTRAIYTAYLAIQSQVQVIIHLQLNAIGAANGMH